MSLLKDLKTKRKAKAAGKVESSTLTKEQNEMVEEVSDFIHSETMTPKSLLELMDEGAKYSKTIQAQTRIEVKLRKNQPPPAAAVAVVVVVSTTAHK